MHRSVHCASLMAKHICSQMDVFRLNDNGQIIKSSKLAKNKARSAKNLPETLAQWAENKKSSTAGDNSNHLDSAEAGVGADSVGPDSRARTSAQAESVSMPTSSGDPEITSFTFKS